MGNCNPCTGHGRSGSQG